MISDFFVSGVPERHPPRVSSIVPLGFEIDSQCLHLGDGLLCCSVFGVLSYGFLVENKCCLDGVLVMHS